MIRLPVIPTLIVALAAAIMIALGIWQLHRADWKKHLLAEYARAESLPPVDLDPLLERAATPGVPLAFRRALVTCRGDAARPQVRASSNLNGDSGYGYFIPCRPGDPGLAGRLMINAGWSADPAAVKQLAPGGLVAGTIGAVADAGPVYLTSARTSPPLQPSAPPSIDDIPNNHLFYAFQWFFFAAAAVVIYLLALRRRHSPAP